MGLCLWLVPSSNDASLLKNVMAFRDSGTEPTSSKLSKNTYPAFEPHITLASFPPDKADVDSLKQAIPSSTGPFSVDFRSVEVGSHYFRSVFIAIKASEALVDLHKAIHTTVGLESHTPLFPHLSLCYIADEDAAERGVFHQGLIYSGKVKYLDASDGDGVSINCGVGSEATWLSGLQAHEIWIVDATGEVETWTVKEKILLSSTDNTVTSS